MLANVEFPCGACNKEDKQVRKEREGNAGDKQQEAGRVEYVV